MSTGVPAFVREGHTMHKKKGSRMANKNMCRVGYGHAAPISEERFGQINFDKPIENQVGQRVESKDEVHGKVKIKYTI